jgi:hypothetical protein
VRKRNGPHFVYSLKNNLTLDRPPIGLKFLNIKVFIINLWRYASFFMAMTGGINIAQRCRSISKFLDRQRGRRVYDDKKQSE